MAQNLTGVRVMLCNSICVCSWVSTSDHLPYMSVHSSASLLSICSLICFISVPVQRPVCSFVCLLSVNSSDLCSFICLCVYSAAFLFIHPYACVCSTASLFIYLSPTWELVSVLLFRRSPFWEEALTLV